MLAVVGNYILGRELGSGGMGVVYAAHHRVLGHAVAVKLLRADSLQHRAELDRFFNEARAAMAIAHPAIVQVFDVGMAEDGRAFIAMELLDGEPLAQRLDAGTLPVRVAVEYARQLAAALDAAHTAGIVHRDLKPANVIVCRDGRLKLVDFGIAKLESSVGLTRTATGVVLGTPSYMSPEQCAGQRDLDARSDLYALGCVIFAMLTGGPPFHGETGAVIGMHQFVAPPRLRTRCPSATPALEAVVDGLLAKSPADRFQSARAVAAALAAPDVAELAATPGVEPTADLRPGELVPAPAPVRLERTPPPRAPAPLAPASLAPAPATTAAVPRRARRAPWIVGLFTIAAAATALLLWQCNAKESATQVAAGTPDAAPAPPPTAIDAATPVTVVVTETVDARVATAVDARVATAKRSDARPAIATARIDAIVPPPSPPDAAPTPTVVEPTNDDDDDVSIRTFLSNKGHRLKFGSGNTVTKTGSDLAKPLTGSFKKLPRKREIRIEWDHPADDGIARERFQHISCGLDRLEWADGSQNRHSDGETYNQTDPPCSE